MTEEPKVVDNNAGEATTQPPVEASFDFEKEYVALLEEMDRVSKDRNNYREGLLKAKGKVEDPDAPESETEDERIERVVQQTLAKTQSATIAEKQSKLLENLVKQNKELKTALVNRSQISASAQTTSPAEPKAAPTETFWSEDQLAYFKKRGIDPNKVKTNIKK